MRIFSNDYWHMEVISIVRVLKRLSEYFVIRRYGRGKVVKFGYIDTNIKDKVVFLFHFFVPRNPSVITIVHLIEISTQDFILTYLANKQSR